jgi:hypothetical protein
MPSSTRRDRSTSIVNQVDGVRLAEALPGAGGGGGLDRDAALLLLLEEVHDRGPLVHLADLVAAAGVEENALGDRRLARVDVGADADVPELGEIDGHGTAFCPTGGRDRAVRPAENPPGSRRHRGGGLVELSSAESACP